MMDWDPNILLEPDKEPCRIYADDKGEFYALVSPEDYQWALQWRWSPKWSRGGNKVYLRRNVQIGPRANRIQSNLFLHRAIMVERIRIDPPSPEHTIVDHVAGNGLNCQRSNLRWFTPKQNARNRRKDFDKEAFRMSLGL